MKYLKTIMVFFSLLFITTIINTIFYYFNITSSSANNIIKIIIFIIVFIITGIYIGKNSSKKGWLEGLKISGIIIGIFLLLSLIFKYNFNIIQILYYLICTLMIVLGSIIGINFKKKK